MEVKSEETRPDNDATDAVQDTSSRMAAATPRAVYRLARARVNAIQRSVRKRKEAARAAADTGEPASASPLQDTAASRSATRTGNANTAKDMTTAPRYASEAPDTPPDPAGRPLSARELGKVRESRRKRSQDTRTGTSHKTADLPADQRSLVQPHGKNASLPQNQIPEGATPPRMRLRQTGLLHERPAPSLPQHREILRQPVKSNHIIERQAKQAIKTADVATNAVAKRASATMRMQTKAAGMAKDVAAENAAKAARHLAKVSSRAAARAAAALRQAARAAMRAVAAAGKALVGAIVSGGWVVVVVILVLLMCASILASPFGIFTHTDTTTFPDSISLDKAITTINEEFAGQIRSLRSNAESVQVSIEGNQEGGVEPCNWVDVLGVFAVHVTMRQEGAMDVVQLDKARVAELRRIFFDMNRLSTSTETEDGETTLYIEGRSMSYRDMYGPYAFTDAQKELIEELMSDRYYAFWSNFVNLSMGYGEDDWSGVISVDEDYEPGMSGGVMKIPKIYQFDYRKTVCKINGENKSVSTSGCGATSMSMVIRYLTGDSSQTPYTLFKWAYKEGYYSGDGLGHSAVSAMGKLYGVTGSWVGKDGKKITKALTGGHPVIAHMGPGLFTKGGHYIVLRGVTEDGKILVNDPNSKSRSGKAYPLSTILKQAKTSTPFMICSRKSN